MRVLVTGAEGFIGKNLCLFLEKAGEEVLKYDINTREEELFEYLKSCDFVFNLAGVNRPQNEEEFKSGNCGFLKTVLSKLQEFGNKCPVMLSSSIQAELDNPYGKSKKAAEDELFSYSEKTGVPVYIYRFPNVFGKWARPNYNSAVATFCNNIAADLPIRVNDRNTVIELLYIDDLCEEMLSVLNGKPNRSGKFCVAAPTFKRSLGEITDLLYSFRKSRETLSVIDTDDGFQTRLYATYLSYLPKDSFSYPLCTHRDERGSFTEILRTKNAGQFSVNISKPGITKGNHWHHTKNEKFVVVKGRGVIRFRKPGESEITEYFVSGDEMKVVDIPTGYTHSIVNLSDEDMVTFMWCSECFNPEKPDTFYEEV